MGALFDRYLIVDWSGASVPTTGKDSIWIALHDGEQMVGLENPTTRLAAMEIIRGACADAVDAGSRLFAGFDFAFGWPKRSFQTLCPPSQDLFARSSSAPNPEPGNNFRDDELCAWDQLWHFLAEHIEDNDANANNAFELAGRLNQDHAPFWGHPYQHAGRYPGLRPKKPIASPVSEWREVERAAKGAKSVWQLAYNGAVGRQSMLGVAHLERLRRELGLKASVWPFETGFADKLDRPVTIAEIYPSLFDVRPEEGEVPDAAQVRTVAQTFATLDAGGKFKALLARPMGVSSAVEREEGWIVGATPKSSGSSVDEDKPAYICDPAEIYAQSFATIEAEVDLSSYTKAMRKVVTRLIHACGMTDIVSDLAFSNGAAEAGVAALARGSTVYCDVEMVRAGIIARNLPVGVSLACTLNDPRAAAHGKTLQTTRSAAAVEFWEELEGSICVIGNAPTALFRLLERIDEGAGKPALIIGIPVGFVGAVESKAELASNPRSCPFITVHGRRGGSAMASSVLNALAGLV